MDDLDISYPLKPQSVPTSTLVVVSFGVPILLVLALELAVPTKRRPAMFVMTRIAWVLAGIAFTVVITNLGKKVAGRLRPNFLARCKVDPAKLSSALASHAAAYPLPGAGGMGLVTRTPFHASEVCSTPAGASELEEGRHSFPSGHASLSAYAGTVAALYLQQAVRPPAGVSALAVPMAQLACVSWGVVVGLTRYSDAFHHGTDILAGAAIGVGVAAYVYSRLLLPRPAPAGTDTLADAEAAAAAMEAAATQDPDRDTPLLAAAAGAGKQGAFSSSGGALARRRGTAAATQGGQGGGSPAAAAYAEQGLAWEPSRCGSCLLVRRLSAQELREADRWCKYAKAAPAADDGERVTEGAAAPSVSADGVEADGSAERG